MDGRIQRHEGYKTSLKVRKRIEEAFGWIKTVGGLAKTKLVGHAKLTGQALLCFATYNLVRPAHRRLVGRASCVKHGVSAPKWANRPETGPEKGCAGR